MQRSSLLLVAKIQWHQDLAGFQRQNDIHLSNSSCNPGPFPEIPSTVRIVLQTYSMNLLLRDAVAASSAWYNEYHTLINSGLDEEDLQVFFSMG